MEIKMYTTSSSRLLCSFCCSIRFCLSASSWRLYSSCSRSCCSWRSCWRRSASDRSLFSCCRRMKSRRSVDSPGTLTMELNGGKTQAKVVVLIKKKKHDIQWSGTFEEGPVGYTIPGLSLLLWGIFFLFFTATVFILCFICINNNMLKSEPFVSVTESMAAALHGKIILSTWIVYK